MPLISVERVTPGDILQLNKAVYTVTAVYVDAARRAIVLTCEHKDDATQTTAFKCHREVLVNFVGKCLRSSKEKTIL